MNKNIDVQRIQRRNFEVTASKPQSKVIGFMFTWSLAIGTGYGIIHWLIPLMVK